MRIKSWHFATRQHRELVSRSLIAMQVIWILMTNKFSYYLKSFNLSNSSCFLQLIFFSFFLNFQMSLHMEVSIYLLFWKKNIYLPYYRWIFSPFIWCYLYYNFKNKKVILSGLFILYFIHIKVFFFEQFHPSVYYITSIVLKIHF